MYDWQAVSKSKYAIEYKRLVVCSCIVLGHNFTNVISVPDDIHVCVTTRIKCIIKALVYLFLRQRMCDKKTIWNQRCGGKEKES